MCIFVTLWHGNRAVSWHACPCFHLIPWNPVEGHIWYLENGIFTSIERVLHVSTPYWVSDCTIVTVLLLLLFTVVSAPFQCPKKSDSQPKWSRRNRGSGEAQITELRGWCFVSGLLCFFFPRCCCLWVSVCFICFEIFQIPCLQFYETIYKNIVLATLRCIAFFNNTKIQSPTVTPLLFIWASIITVTDI